MRDPAFVARNLIERFFEAEGGDREDHDEIPPSRRADEEWEPPGGDLNLI